MIKKVMDFISELGSPGMKIEMESPIGLVMDRGVPRFQRLDQPVNGVLPQILSPALLVFEKPKGLEIKLYIQQQVPALVEGVTLPLPPSGYEYKIEAGGLVIRRYLWPGDWDNNGILPEVLEETCDAFYQVYLLYCQEEIKGGGRV